MAKEEEPDGHDLKAFEAALAALRPRSDRLQRDRLMFLAGQALAESRQERTGVQRKAASSGLDEPFPAPLPACGQSGSQTASYRWGWPAAFAAMTCIAASLVLVLVIRPPQVVPQIVERVVEVPASSPAAASAHEAMHNRDVAADGPLTPWPQRLAEQPSGWMALLWALCEQSPSASSLPPAGVGYRRLRDLEVAQGLDARPTPAAASDAANGVFVPSRPSSQRELLEELIETREPRRPERPAEGSLESISYPGAKS